MDPKIGIKEGILILLDILKVKEPCILNMILILGSCCQLWKYSRVFIFNIIYIFDISAEPLGDFKEANYNHLFLLLIVPQKE